MVLNEAKARKTHKGDTLYNSDILYMTIGIYNIIIMGRVFICANAYVGEYNVCIIRRGKGSHRFLFI